jgi:SAM-dependent methyltransferase
MQSKLHISNIPAIRINLQRQQITMGPTHKIPDPDDRVNILYYDAIADEYETMLNNDVKNLLIRDVVAKKFSTVVKGGHVLDFGGGTGLDLKWLIKHRYPVSFCEPSDAMRRIAMESVLRDWPDAAISFLNDEQTDFRNWTESFPFGEARDAALANFAVINCIPDLGFLFEKLSLVLKPGGQLIALVLDDHFLKRLRSNPRDTIRSIFSRKPVNLVIEYKNQRQKVYVYSVSAIRKASIPKFDLISHNRLKGFGFRLIHLIRK